jgi:hypothetical protein
MISFDSLIFERLAFEVRYKGPLYLDRCGVVWRELESKYPELAATGIAADGANFQIKSRATSIKFGLRSTVIVEDFPTSLASLSEIADFLLPAIVKNFEIEIFERIGARYVFVLPVKEKSEADHLLLDTDIVKVSDQRVKLFGSEVADLGVKFNVQDEDQGYTFNIAAASRELEGTFPRLMTVDDHKIARRMLIIDADRFTRKSVGAGTLSPSDFVRMGYKTISNNLNKFLNSRNQ